MFDDRAGAEPFSFRLAAELIRRQLLELD